MGRRLKYTEGEFERASQRYLSSIRYKRPLLDSSGQSVINELGCVCEETVWIEPPNVSYWALYLGIAKSTLTSLYRQRYPDTYEKIKTVLEAYNTRELLLRRTGAEAIKFNLQNNYGWRDTRSAEDTCKDQAASQPPLSLSEKLDRINELIGRTKQDRT